MAILWLITWKVDLSAAIDHTSKQNLTLVLLAFAICFLQIGLGAVRWQIALRALGARPPFRETAKFFYISIFFNAWLPGGVGGDFMRAWLSYRAEINAKVAITSVVLDRLAALLGIAVLVLFTMPSYLGQVGYSLLTVLPITVSMIGLIGVILIAFLRRLPAPWIRFRILRMLRDFGYDVRTVFFAPRNAIPLIIVAMAGQAALGFMTYAMALSLDIRVSLAECIVLMQPVALISNLPITVGGWGVRETAILSVFGLVGVSPAASLALSIQLGLLLLVIALPGGLLWLFSRPRNGKRCTGTTPMQSENLQPPHAT